jgi:hypothetical protein
MVLHTGDGAISLCTDGSSLSLEAPALATPMVITAP